MRQVSFCPDDATSGVKNEPTQVFCLRCSSNRGSAAKNENEMVVESIPDGAIVVENSAFTLVFDEDTKLLSTITHKASGKTENVQVDFVKSLLRIKVVMPTL